MIEPAVCPECEGTPFLFNYLDRTMALGCVKPGSIFIKIHICDTGALTRDQLVALWNERVKKILQTKKETK